MNSVAEGETFPASDEDTVSCLEDENIQAGSSYQSEVAAMRRACSEKEIMALETLKENSVDLPRWHLGDIENYTILDKVGSGTYG